MPDHGTQQRSRAPWLVGASLLALAMGVSAWAMTLRGLDPRGLLGAIGGAAAARVNVTVGAVANGAGVGGDAVLRAARDGIDDALSSHTGAAQPAARGARVTRNGHVFDANVVRVERASGRVRAEVSVVVSTAPGRAYEFASTSAITLTGPSADTDEGLTDAVRRATRSASAHALEQLSAR